MRDNNSQKPIGDTGGARLRREISLFGLTIYGVGSILGAGIYALIGAAAALAEEGLWLAFLLSALIALLTGLSYAELAAMFPRAGAEYHYVRNGFESPRLGFLAGWALIVGAATGAATVALAFAGYLEQLADVPRLLGAFVLIGLLSAVNFVGIRHSTAVNILLTLV
jgi:APA family basic amino acid/polyamine antiporter